MTARRQEGNRVGPGSQFRSGIALIALVLATLANSLWQSPAPASTTERVVVNRYTGLAIEGFDPVGYFVDAGPVIGQEHYEAAQAGAVWRFRNEGNRAAFIAHPEIYGPQFGGYDPVDIARGVTVAGNPLTILTQVGGKGFNGPSHFTFAIEDDRLASMTITA